MIRGDFNRIGREGMLYNGEENQERKKEKDREEKQERKNSKDKVKNGEGVKMLKMVAEQGWHILNGNIEGDENGEYLRRKKRRVSHRLRGDKYSKHRQGIKFRGGR